MLTRDQILSQKKLKKEKVRIPEWDGEVFVSEMSGTDRDEWEYKTFYKEKDTTKINMRARLAVFTLVDEDGKRLFTEADIDEVGKLSSEALLKICTVASKLNGLATKDLKDAQKNS